MTTRSARALSPSQSELDLALDLAASAAGTDMPVALIGDVPTLLREVALSIHRDSARRRRPCVVVDAAQVAGLPVALFGEARYLQGDDVEPHVATTAGALERASGGTLVLENVDQLPLTVQSALLRVLDTRVVYREGAVLGAVVDLRIVSTTSHDLGRLVASGAFRADLFHRLTGFPIWIAPPEDRSGRPSPLWMTVPCVSRGVADVTSLPAARRSAGIHPILAGEGGLS
ncbi:MAG: sigma 54-interacting transcriptional regulator [Myxococcales bacterium]|nr:sigma 54-interacting transcriptional regulator [Myxococcales bacterium]